MAWTHHVTFHTYAQAMEIWPRVPVALVPRVLINNVSREVLTLDTRDTKWPDMDDFFGRQPSVVLYIYLYILARKTVWAKLTACEITQLGTSEQKNTRKIIQTFLVGKHFIYRIHYYHTSMQNFSRNIKNKMMVTTRRMCACADEQYTLFFVCLLVLMKRLLLLEHHQCSPSGWATKGHLYELEKQQVTVLNHGVCNEGYSFMRDHTEKVAVCGLGCDCAISINASCVSVQRKL